MADRTHSHDTSTPAMSAETVPSEEFVLVPREPTPAMVDAGRIYGWDDPEHEASCIGHPETREAIYRAMIAAAPILSASHLAEEGGEAGAVEAEVERLSKVYAEATGYYVPFHAGLHSESSNRIRTGVKAVLAAAPQPSPALAKGGDAVREAEEIADNWRDLALQFDAHRIQALSWLKAMVADAETHKAGASGFLASPPLSGEKVLAERIVALFTPTEGPASQTEGMGRDRVWLDRRVAHRHAVELEQCSIFAADVGDAIAKSMTDAAADLRAALTAPETAEAVPVASDPAPATDDRERLVEALARTLFVAHSVAANDEKGRDRIVHWDEGTASSHYDGSCASPLSGASFRRTWEAVARAALATEASK